MNINKKQLFKVIAVAQILVLFVLAGCDVQLPVNICHATGDPTTPYEVITITTTAEVEEHVAHPNDLYPVPEGGCPTTLVEVDNDKITICHATTSTTNPYREIIVSVNGLNGHGDHPGDIVPAPAGGCPTSPLEVVEGEVSICHATGIAEPPYEEMMVNINGMDGHVDHVGDIVPVPAGGCPTILLEVVDGKVSICHATSSAKNPYREINVSVNGLNGHALHEGDIFPSIEGDCPDTLLDIFDDKITICHATGSDKNPYIEMTVSVNGLNGHGKHEGDIIPAAPGSCPSTK
jgi:hypothetical protein